MKSVPFFSLSWLFTVFAFVLKFSITEYEQNVLGDSNEYTHFLYEVPTLVWLAKSMQMCECMCLYWQRWQLNVANVPIL